LSDPKEFFFSYPVKKAMMDFAEQLMVSAAFAETGFASERSAAIDSRGV